MCTSIISSTGLYARSTLPCSPRLSPQRGAQSDDFGFDDLDNIDQDDSIADVWSWMDEMEELDLPFRRPQEQGNKSNEQTHCLDNQAPQNANKENRLFEETKFKKIKIYNADVLLITNATIRSQTGNLCTEVSVGQIAESSKYVDRGFEMPRIIQRTVGSLRFSPWLHCRLPGLWALVYMSLLSSIPLYLSTISIAQTDTYLSAPDIHIT